MSFTFAKTMSSPCYLKCQNDTNSSKCNFLKKHEFKKRMPATFVSKFLPVSEFYYFLKRVRFDFSAA